MTPGGQLRGAWPSSVWSEKILELTKMPSDQEDLDWQKMILHAALELRENSQNCPTSVSGIRKTILGDNVLTESEIVLGLPDFEIIGIERKEGNVIPGRGSARIAGGRCLRSKGWVHRTVRLEDWGLRHSMSIETVSER
jgi:hypothetical protein